MEENKFGIKKFNPYNNLDIKNLIYIYNDNNNHIVTYRIIEYKSFGIRIKKLYGRE